MDICPGPLYGHRTLAGARRGLIEPNLATAGARYGKLGMAKARLTT
jgi:hypothetical protein